MSAMDIQITGASIVCSAVCSGEYQRKHQSSTSLPFVGWIHQWPVHSPHKGPVTRKMFPFNDVIMKCTNISAVNSFLAQFLVTEHTLCQFTTHWTPFRKDRHVQYNILAPGQTKMRTPINEIWCNNRMENTFIEQMITSKFKCNKILCEQDNTIAMQIHIFHRWIKGLNKINLSCANYASYINQWCPCQKAHQIK